MGTKAGGLPRSELYFKIHLLSTISLLDTVKVYGYLPAEPQGYLHIILKSLKFFLLYRGIFYPYETDVTSMITNYKNQYKISSKKYKKLLTFFSKDS